MDRHMNNEWENSLYIIKLKRSWIVNIKRFIKLIYKFETTAPTRYFHIETVLEKIAIWINYSL